MRRRLRGRPRTRRPRVPSRHPRTYPKQTAALDVVVEEWASGGRRFCTPRAEWGGVAGEDGALASVGRAEAVSIKGSTGSAGWDLDNVPFLAGNGAVGSMVFDTGACRTVVSSEFLERAGLLETVRVHSDAFPVRRLRVADGGALDTVGVVDIEFFVQLMLDVSEEGDDDPIFVHWDRGVLLRNVYVMPPGRAAPPRDILVAYND